MMRFKTSTGDYVEGRRLQAALNTVSSDLEQLAYDIYREDAYADHVTQSQKDTLLREALDHARAVRAGRVTDFTTWQRVNEVLTGKCVAFLP